VCVCVCVCVCVGVCVRCVYKREIYLHMQTYSHRDVCECARVRACVRESDVYMCRCIFIRETYLDM